jgi:hypothetical protein
MITNFTLALAAITIVLALLLRLNRPARGTKLYTVGNYTMAVLCVLLAIDAFTPTDWLLQQIATVPTTVLYLLAAGLFLSAFIVNMRIPEGPTTIRWIRNLISGTTLIAFALYMLLVINRYWDLHLLEFLKELIDYRKLNN